MKGKKYKQPNRKKRKLQYITLKNALRKGKGGWYFKASREALEDKESKVVEEETEWIRQMMERRYKKYTAEVFDVVISIVDEDTSDNVYSVNLIIKLTKK